MHIELWWLLLIPAVFFTLGWVAARIDIRQLLTEARELPRTYFEGLNHLLNDEPEKAINAFMVAADKDKDSKSLDLHFALGTLFRRQGEFSRAIRIHKSLLERPSLTKEERERAQFELAQDFHRAGLLDRAEKIFQELEGAKFEGRALNDLLEIYETEKKWTEAIRVRKQMDDLAKTPSFKEIAQYYCELAQEAIVEGNLDAAREHLEHAFEEHRGCARAYLLKGDIAFTRNFTDKALSIWGSIASHAPGSLGLAADRVMKLFRDCESEEQRLHGIRLLASWQQEHPSPDIFTAVFELSRSFEPVEKTIRRIKDEIDKRPSLINLNHLLDMQILNAQSQAEQQNLAQVKELITPYLKKTGFYRCSYCGFRSRNYYWRCPGCQKWETTNAHRNDISEGFNH
ncbi:MAG: lipopolysaccharide assembly protein LapB [Burkholderiales bacterium]|nr:lipopolysaccharide assembly protein LapB [Burkholderiales bacterium]